MIYFLESSGHDENHGFGDITREFMSHEKRRTKEGTWGILESEGRVEEGSILLWFECSCPPKFIC